MESESLRIAIVTHNFPPHMGGVEQTALYHARALAERGHRVTVWAGPLPAHLEHRPDPEGEFQLIRQRQLLRVQNMPLVPGLLRLRRRDYDVVHMHMPYLFGAELVGPLTALRRIPLVVSFHSSQNDGRLTRLLRHPSAGALGDFYIRHLSTRLIGHARRICLIAEDQAEHPSSPLRHLIRRHPERACLVPYGVDRELFYPPAEAGRWAGERLELVWCGRLDQSSADWKRPDAAIRLAHSLPDHVAMTIAGSGSLLPRWQQLANDGPGQITFTGALSQPELAELYRRSDALVSTSVSTEGRPLSILEAMGTGLPVIVANIAGINSLIAHGHNGLLYEAGSWDELQGNVLELATSDRAALAGLGAAAERTIAERFSWEQSSAALERALLDAAGHHS